MKKFLLIMLGSLLFAACSSDGSGDGLGHKVGPDTEGSPLKSNYTIAPATRDEVGMEKVGVSFDPAQPGLNDVYISDDAGNSLQLTSNDGGKTYYALCHQTGVNLVSCYDPNQNPIDPSKTVQFDTTKNIKVESTGGEEIPVNSDSDLSTYTPPASADLTGTPDTPVTILSRDTAFEVAIDASQFPADSYGDIIAEMNGGTPSPLIMDIIDNGGNDVTAQVMCVADDNVTITCHNQAGDTSTFPIPMTGVTIDLSTETSPDGTPITGTQIDDTALSGITADDTVIVDPNEITVTPISSSYTIGQLKRDGTGATKVGATVTETINTGSIVTTITDGVNTLTLVAAGTEYAANCYLSAAGKLTCINPANTAQTVTFTMPAKIVATDNSVPPVTEESTITVGNAYVAPAGADLTVTANPLSPIGANTPVAATVDATKFPADPYGYITCTFGQGATTVAMGVTPQDANSATATVTCSNIDGTNMKCTSTENPTGITLPIAGNAITCATTNDADGAANPITGTPTGALALSPVVLVLTPSIATVDLTGAGSYTLSITASEAVTCKLNTVNATEAKGTTQSWSLASVANSDNITINTTPVALTPATVADPVTTGSLSVVCTADSGKGSVAVPVQWDTHYTLAATPLATEYTFPQPVRGRAETVTVGIHSADGTLDVTLDDGMNTLALTPAAAYDYATTCYLSGLNEISCGAGPTVFSTSTLEIVVEPIANTTIQGIDEIGAVTFDGSAYVAPAASDLALPATPLTFIIDETDGGDIRIAIDAENFPANEYGDITATLENGTGGTLDMGIIDNGGAIITGIVSCTYVSASSISCTSDGTGGAQTGPVTFDVPMSGAIITPKTELGGISNPNTGYFGSAIQLVADADPVTITLTPLTNTATSIPMQKRDGSERGYKIGANVATANTTGTISCSTDTGMNLPLAAGVAGAYCFTTGVDTVSCYQSVATDGQGVNLLGTLSPMPSSLTVTCTDSGSGTVSTGLTVPSSGSLAAATYPANTDATGIGVVKTAPGGDGVTVDFNANKTQTLTFSIDATFATGATISCNIIQAPTDLLTSVLDTVDGLLLLGSETTAFPLTVANPTGKVNTTVASASCTYNEGILNLVGTEFVCGGVDQLDLVDLSGLTSLLLGDDSYAAVCTDGNITGISDPFIVDLPGLLGI